MLTTRSSAPCVLVCLDVHCATVADLPVPGGPQM